MLAYDGYEQDVNYITEQCRFMLRVLGIWPIFVGKISLATRIQNLFAILTCYILLFCAIIPGMLYYIYGIEPDPRVRLKYLVVHAYACMTVAKYSSLVLHERDIRSCLSHVKEDWRMFGDASYRQCMIQRARTARRFFLFCWAFMYFSNLCYSAFVPLSRGKVMIDENTTIRSLFAPAYYVFFDEQKSPAYEIVFLIQAVASFVTSTTTITLCGLTAVFVMHACAQLEILTEMMGNCVRQEILKKETLNRKLAIVVGHHIRVRNFVHMVEISLQESSLVEIVGCTSIVCLLGYCVLLELEDGNTAAAFSFVFGAASISFNIFLLCYIGDQLNTQCGLSLRNTAGLNRMLAYDGYEQDVNYITEQCRFMLRILGIWPIFQGKVSVATRIQNLFAILTCYILLFCSVIPGSLYYIYGVEPDLQVRLKFLVVHVYACMTVAKYSSLVLHERDIRSCLSHLKEDWRMFGDASYRKLMIHRATTARRFFLFCWAFMYFSNLCYSAFVPLSRGKVVIDENTTIRPLSAPAYYVFFDEQKSPAYEIVFLIQALSSFVTSTITITLCGLTAVFVMHACAQLEILTEILGNCVREETVKKETLNRKLAIVVGHHIRVRNFVHMVEISLQESSLVEIVGCTSIVCLLGYCILLVTIVLLYSNGQCKISDGLRYSVGT
ncbi:hypothetical protein KM043_005931 [Ampulex compressa]|nr:hypothetical protein KM043_005931 [Ampulex compressa]